MTMEDTVPKKQDVGKHSKLKHQAEKACSKTRVNLGFGKRFCCRSAGEDNGRNRQILFIVPLRTSLIFLVMR